MPVAEDDDEQPATNTDSGLIWDTRKLFAAFGVRMFAVGLDLFIAIFIAGGVQDYLLAPVGLPPVDNRVVILAVLLLYFPLFWSSQLRATPAQLLLGVRVVDETGDKLGPARALLRSALLVGLMTASVALFKSESNFLFIVLALVGYGLLFLAAVTSNRQAGHDLLAHSLVVNRVALKSPAQLDLLREHVSNSNSESGKQHRPSAIKIAGNLLLLVVPVVFLFNAAQMAKDRDLRYRTIYAIEHVADLKTAVNLYYLEHNRWPSRGTRLGTATKAPYPDGGYYELEDGGVIRIRFTVKPELKKGSIVLTPKLEDDKIVWQCRSEGDIARHYLGSWCRG